MCGINLLLDRKSKLPSTENIRLMAAATQHRGPDHQAWLTLKAGHQQFFIANNRLKILDLGEEANQPMHCGEKGKEGKRFTLTYNGELYNYYELKNELLQKGYSFRSTSDTEVLLYMLAEWGEEALTRLDGMFAFAFYDQEKEQLLIVRDPLGMKPLYYFINDHFLIVSSEIKGILASQLVQKELNESQVYHYLQFRYAQKPHTFYQHIYELLPGHLISFKVGEGTEPVIKKYHLAEKGEEKEDTDVSSTTTIIQKVEEKLTDALFSHLQADRATGMFLSGGIDSTLMLALLRNNGSYQIPDCFTIVNSEKEAAWGTQDYLWATRAAKKYNARHFPLEISFSILEHFQAYIAEQDQPIGDSAAWLTSLLSGEAAGKKVKVILSGAGADELFGGYNRHAAFYTYLKHYQKIRPFIPWFKPVGKILPTGRIPQLRKPLRLLNKFLTEVNTSPAQTFLNFLSFPILPKPLAIDIEQEPGSFLEGWMMSALQHDRKSYLVSDILALNDKASMQHSLEMRMPYMSQDLWSFAEQLPASLLMQKGPKWLLAEILTCNGGEDFTRRRKEGFGLPFGLWVKEGKTDFLWEWVEEKDHLLWRFLPKSSVVQLLHRHKSGQEDYSQELFSLAVLAHWLTKEFT